MLHPSFQPNDLPWTPFQHGTLPLHGYCFGLSVLLLRHMESSWTRLRQPLVLASFHLALVMTPKPSLPLLAAPTMSLWRSLASASAAALLADHFRPVWTVMFAWQTFWSLLSHSIITWQALATLNSSITDVFSWSHPFLRTRRLGFDGLEPMVKLPQVNRILKWFKYPYKT